MPIRALFFDFDGTLADSYPAIAASVNHVRAHYDLAPLSAEQVRPHVGRGLQHLLTNCMPGADPALATKLYREHHPSVLQSGTVLLPGAMDVLTELNRRGLKLAICSNKPVPFTRMLVRILGMASLIDEVIGPEDVANPKPAPDMILEALKRFALKPYEVIFVGDMTVDIQTARFARVHVWVVPTGSDTRATLEAAKPDRLLDSLSQILDLLSAINR